MSEPAGSAAAGRPVPSGTWRRIASVVLVAALVAVVIWSPGARKLEQEGLIEFSALGNYAPLALIGGYVAAASLLLPVFPLDLAAGAHFDFWVGVFWVQVAATTASVGGYFVGGWIFRRVLDRLMERKPQLRQLERAANEEGWKIVFLTRLSPVFSFSLLSGFYGAVRVPFGPYILATFVGMLPGTMLYVYAGDIAGDLSGTPDNPGYSEWQWWAEMLGFAATAVLIVYVTRRAQNILSAKLEGAPPHA